MVEKQYEADIGLHKTLVYRFVYSRMNINGQRNFDLHCDAYCKMDGDNDFRSLFWSAARVERDTKVFGFL